MAVLRTRVVGPVVLPDGALAPSGGKLVFTLSNWDRQNAAVVMHGAVDAPILNGGIDVQLFRTQSGERGTTYDVVYVYFNSARRANETLRLGTISLTGAGPVNLAELLTLPAPLPTVPDALAQALGAAASAKADAAQTSEDREATERAAAAAEIAKAAAQAAASGVEQFYRPLVDAPIAQRKMCDLFTGVTAADEPYENSRVGSQGYATILMDGARWQFVTQNAQSEPERKRIVKYGWGETGAMLPQVEVSGLLNVGHGQDLSAVIEDGQLYLHCQSESGRGFTRIRWQGAVTTQSDVTTYEILPDTARSATVGVSKDGKYLALAYTTTFGTYSSTEHRMAIYSLQDALANGPNASPLHHFNLEKPRSAGARYMQGVAIHNGMIATVHGYNWPLFRNWVFIYDFEGNVLRRIAMDNGRADAGYAACWSGPNVPVKFEPEGLDFTEDGTLLVKTDEAWKVRQDVVSHRGLNFALMYESSSTAIGIPPSTKNHWVRTTAPANKGEWDAATTYSVGAFARRCRAVHAIVLADGNPANKPLDGGICLEDANSPLYGNDTAVDLSWMEGDFNGALYDPVLGEYRRTFTFHEENQFRIHDARAAYADKNTTFFSIRQRNDLDLAELRFNGAVSNGYGENWAKAGNSYAKREYAGGQIRRELLESGWNKFYASGNPTMQHNRTEYSFLETFRINEVTHGGIAAVETSLTINTQNGKDFVIATNAGEGTIGTERLRIKNDTGALWAGQDNMQALGVASRRWTQVYAAANTINTSDAREKDQIAEFSDAERRVALAAKGLLRKFKWRDAVAKKGAGARVHFGIIAQDLQAAFEAEGLDPFAYGVLCHDDWPEQAEERDADDDIISPYQPAGDRYGVRYEELLVFILAAL